VNALAEDRRVVVFDNTSVGKSSGETPDNVAQMATDATSVLFRPRPENVDLLGYLLGGFIAQVIACEHPPLAEEFYSSAPLRGVVRIHLLHQVLHECPTLAPDASIRTRAAHSPRSL
jgi:pimeloyl-ACP methyl ester carboxylesterase